MSSRLDKRKRENKFRCKQERGKRFFLAPLGHENWKLNGCRSSSSLSSSFFSLLERALTVRLSYAHIAGMDFCCCCCLVLCYPCFFISWCLRHEIPFSCLINFFSFFPLMLVHRFPFDQSSKVSLNHTDTSLAQVITLVYVMSEICRHQIILSMQKQENSWPLITPFSSRFLSLSLSLSFILMQKTE